MHSVSPGDGQPCLGPSEQPRAPSSVPWIPKGTFAVARLTPPLSHGGKPPSPPFFVAGEGWDIEGDTSGRGGLLSPWR